MTRDHTTLAWIIVIVAMSVSLGALIERHEGTKTRTVVVVCSRDGTKTLCTSEPIAVKP